MSCHECIFFYLQVLMYLPYRVFKCLAFESFRLLILTTPPFLHMRIPFIFSVYLNFHPVVCIYVVFLKGKKKKKKDLFTLYNSYALIDRSIMGHLTSKRGGEACWGSLGFIYKVLGKQTEHGVIDVQCHSLYYLFRFPECRAHPTVHKYTYVLVFSILGRICTN